MMYRVARYKSENKNLNDRCLGRLILFNSTETIDLDDKDGRVAPAMIDRFPTFQGRVSFKYIDVVYHNLVKSMEEAKKLYGE